MMCSRALTIVLAIGASIVLALALSKGLIQSEASPSDVRNAGEWQFLIQGGHSHGAEEATVHVVEFSDFQCPFCADIRGDLQQLRQRHEGQIATVYRHFPLDMFEHSFTAALAAECAAEQDRFQQYHDVLFARQESIGTTPWSRFAEDAGISDLADFDACIADERVRVRVEADVEAATNIGVRSTPTLIANGRVFTGAASMEALEDHVDSLVRAHR